MPTVPTDFNAERCFVELQDAGDGVVFQGPKNGPVVRLAFDTQCPWCVWQYEQLKPFLKQVTFIWHPVAVLNPGVSFRAQQFSLLRTAKRSSWSMKRISTTRISEGSMSAMSNCPLMRERRSGTTPKLSPCVRHLGALRRPEDHRWTLYPGASGDHGRVCQTFGAEARITKKRISNRRCVLNAASFLHDPE